MWSDDLFECLYKEPKNSHLSYAYGFRVFQHFFLPIWKEIIIVCQWLHTFLFSYWGKCLLFDDESFWKLQNSANYFVFILLLITSCWIVLPSLYKETTSLYPTARKFEAYLFGLPFVCRDVMASQWQDERIVFSIKKSTLEDDSSDIKIRNCCEELSMGYFRSF